MWTCQTRLFAILAVTLAICTSVAVSIDVRAFRVGPNPPLELYTTIHRMMSDGSHSDVVAAVDAALDSGAPDASPPGVAISTLSFMKGMALYSMGRVKDALESFAASVLAGA